MEAPTFRRTATVLAALASAAAVAGCGGQTISAGDVTVLASERTGGGQTISAGDATVLISERSGGGGEEALFEGRLEVVGGCLGASGTVIVWPWGTQVVVEDPLTVDVPDQGEYALGDDVSLAGGFKGEPTPVHQQSETLEVGGVTVPAECAEHSVFFNQS